MCSKQNKYGSDNALWAIVRRKGTPFEGTSWNQKIYALVPEGCGFCLDIGCGIGSKVLLEKRGYNYLGIDFDDWSGVSVLGDAHHLPFSSNTFNLATLISVLEHFAEPWQAMEEVFRVLAPGGVVVGSVPFLYPYHMRSYYNISHLGVEHIVRQAGFADIHIEPWQNYGPDVMVQYLFPGFQLAQTITRIVTSFLLRLRRPVGHILVKYLAKNSVQRARGLQFIQDDAIRFAAGFDFRALKP